MGPYVDAMLPLKSVEYINASPIDNLGEGSPWFVATMCPKRETFANFWSMVWELGTRVIINLTHERDRVGSGPSDKRERYWPPLEDIDEREISRWPVQPRTLFTESCEQVSSLLRYAVELQGPQPRDGGPRPTRVVALYWYSRWVDFPSSTSIGSRPFYENAWAVLHIALHINSELVRPPQARTVSPRAPVCLLAPRAPALEPDPSLEPSPSPAPALAPSPTSRLTPPLALACPIEQEDLGQRHWTVCHCSAGVGRTGTFIALLRLLRQLPSLESEAALDAAVTTTIEAMREKRLWMVKTDIEYATLYAAVLLRLRNPEEDEFTLTWPLKDGARALPDSERDTAAMARPPAAITTPATAASAAAVPFSPRTRVGGGFGDAAAAGSAGAAEVVATAAAPTPSPVNEEEMAEAAGAGGASTTTQCRMPAALTAASAAGSGSGSSSSRKVRAGCSSSKSKGSRAMSAAEVAALKVRTPEDEDETMMAHVEDEPMEEALVTERVDNTADIAHYAGVGN